MEEWKEHFVKLLRGMEGRVIRKEEEETEEGEEES